MSSRARSYCLIAIAVTILALLFAPGLATVASLFRATQVLVLIYALLAMAASSACLHDPPLSTKDIALSLSVPDFSLAGARCFSRPDLC